MIEVHYHSDMVDLAYAVRNATEDELGEEVELVVDSDLVTRGEVLVVTNDSIVEVYL